MESRPVKYVRVTAPDKDKLAELIKLAIGPSRNMTEFSKECGVNPSTISRILNKKNSGASSDDLIITIAKHADPLSGVTEESLMKAHGMVADVDKQGRVRLSRMYMEESADIITKIITTEILRRSASISELITDARYPIVNGVSLRPDAVYRTNALKGGNELWAFDYLLLPVGTGYQQSEEAEKSMVVSRTSRLVFDRISRMCSICFSGNLPDSIKPSKMSLVINYQDIFKYVSDIYKSFVTPVPMTLIYIDMVKGKIAGEFALKCMNGENEVFFNHIEEKEYEKNDIYDIDDLLLGIDDED